MLASCRLQHRRHPHASPRCQIPPLLASPPPPSPPLPPDEDLLCGDQLSDSTEDTFRCLGNVETHALDFFTYLLYFIFLFPLYLIFNWGFCGSSVSVYFFSLYFSRIWFCLPSPVYVFLCIIVFLVCLFPHFTLVQVSFIHHFLICLTTHARESASATWLTLPGTYSILGR